MKVMFFPLAAYNCGAYGSSTYNSDCPTTPAPSATNPGGLAGTGYDIILPAALALAVVIASVILLIKQIRRKKN